MKASTAKEIADEYNHFETNVKSILERIDKRITKESINGCANIVESINRDYKDRIYSELIKLGYKVDIEKDRIYPSSIAHFFIYW